MCRKSKSRTEITREITAGRPQSILVPRRLGLFPDGSGGDKTNAVAAFRWVYASGPPLFELRFVASRRSLPVAVKALGIYAKPKPSVLRRLRRPRPFAVGGRRRASPPPRALLISTCLTTERSLLELFVRTDFDLYTTGLDSVPYCILLVVSLTITILTSKKRKK